jgi:putative DNA primase/helicase
MKPTFTMFLSTNSKPVINEHGVAIWDRLKPIPFRHTVPHDKRVPLAEMTRRFKEEEAGVLRWAVDGCLQYVKDGRLVEPDVIREEVGRYRSDMDTVGQFLEEVCVTGHEEKVPKLMLYDEYKAWCDDNGYGPLHAQVLWRMLKERGFEDASLRYQHTKMRCWRGLGLRSGRNHISVGAGIHGEFGREGLKSLGGRDTPIRRTGTSGNGDPGSDPGTRLSSLKPVA